MDAGSELVRQAEKRGSAQKGGLRARKASGYQDAFDPVHHGYADASVVSQALRQPPFGGIQLSFPERHLSQVSVDPRQEPLVVQLERETEAVRQQPARL